MSKFSNRGNIGCIDFRFELVPKGKPLFVGAVIFRNYQLWHFDISLT